MEVHSMLSDGSEETYYIDRRKVSLAQKAYVYTYTGQSIPAIELTVGKTKIKVTDSQKKVLAWLEGE